MAVTVSRKAHFNAAHRLFRPDWADEKNEEIFGKCNRPNFHGHNYDLIVKLTGEIDPRTGYLMDLSILKGIINDQVVDYLDHRNLNLDIPEFKKINPTAENIAIMIWKRIRPEIGDHIDVQVRLYETERNFVEFPAGN